MRVDTHGHRARDGRSSVFLIPASVRVPILKHKTIYRDSIRLGRRDDRCGRGWGSLGRDGCGGYGTCYGARRHGAFHNSSRRNACTSLPRHGVFALAERLGRCIALDSRCNNATDAFAGSRSGTSCHRQAGRDYAADCDEIREKLHLCIDECKTGPDGQCMRLLEKTRGLYMFSLVPDPSAEMPLMSMNVLPLAR